MLKRFSISLEGELLAEFDRYIKRRQYNNRSEAIRDLIRNEIVRDDWEADREVVGVVTLVYDHHQRQLQDKITTFQHDYHQLIVSTTHIHMDHHNCLEVIIVRGLARGVRQLAEQLSAIRGVKNGNLTMSSTGGHLR